MNMTTQEFHQYQQVVMKFLGLYDGKCDGVWGPKTIAAKRAWERLPSFEPAVPNLGLPIQIGAKLPAGMRWVPRSNTILISWITDEEYQKIMAESELLTVSDIESPAPASAAYS